MNRHLQRRRTPRAHNLIGILIGMTLLGLLLSQLATAASARSDSPQSDPPLDTTPLATATPPADAALPPEAQAALDAFLAAAAGATLDGAEPAMPVDVLSSISFVYLPSMANPRQIGGGPPPTATATATATATSEPEPEPETAEVSTRLWPDPSIRVIRGGMFSYEIRLKNHGDGSADQIRVTMPYRRDQLTLIGSQLDANAGDWVSAIGDRSITVTFGKLRAGAVRTGRLTFRAAGGLANDTIIDLRATTRWSDNGDGGSDVRSNWAPLLVGSGNASAPWVWTAISPTGGPASTTFRVQSNRFIPGEEVVTWLNTPTGVRPLSLKGTVDALGSITLSLSDSRLAPGSYQIVLYGQRSALTGVASFIIVR